MAAAVAEKAGLVTRVRQRLPWLDHIVRALGRYLADGGDRLAGGATYFAFLSFFPLVALGFSALGFVVEFYPDARDQVRETLIENFPGLVGTGPNQIDIDSIAGARAGAGVIGVLGLLYAGLGWIDALREAIRALWHQNVMAGNIVVKKLKDTVTLVGLGLTLLLSLVVTSLATAATQQLLELVSLEDSTVARVLLRVLGPLLALVVDTVVFVYLFTRLPRVANPIRRVLRAALLGAVLFEVLKLVATTLISRTTGNPVYAGFGIVVGLLVWINFVMRVVLFTACWAVTAPGDSDAAPSGTSSPEQARQAGIPEEYADADPDADPDDPPTLQGGGAPSRLRDAVRRRTAPPHEEGGLGRSDGAVPRVPVAAGGGSGTRVAAGRPRARRGRSAGTAAAAPGRPLPGEQATVRVARAGSVAVVGLVAGVAVYVLRTLRDLVRS